MAESKVTLEQIKEAETNTAYSELKNRILADRELYRLTPFTLKNYKGTKVEASYPITSNKPMVFANRVISALTGATIKCDIEVSGEANRESEKIEEAWATGREAIDAYVKERTSSNLDPHLALTVREQDSLQRIAQGKTNKEIATEMFISPRTIEAHRSNIMHKLGLHTQRELFRYCIRTGIPR